MEEEKIINIKNTIEKLTAAIIEVAENGQAVEIETASGKRKITRANLDEIRRMRSALAEELHILEGGELIFDNLGIGW